MLSAKFCFLQFFLKIFCSLSFIVYLCEVNFKCLIHKSKKNEQSITFVIAHNHER